MTYRHPVAPYVCELRFSGTPTQTAYTYTLTILQQTVSNLLSVSNGTDLNLPAGHYYAQALGDFTRPSPGHWTTARTNQMHWFLDGNQIGKVGGSDYHANESCDAAECAFTLHSSGVLTLRQTASANGSLSWTSDAIAYVWRVPR
jgi:hypothetical protein